jgi:hypothetical protein
MNVLRVGGLFQTYESVTRYAKFVQHRRKRAMDFDLNLFSPISGNFSLQLRLARRYHALNSAATCHAHNARKIDVTA